MSPRQFISLVRLELGKILWGRRALPLYLAAAAPLVLCGIHALISRFVRTGRDVAAPAETAMEFAFVFLFILSGLVYLSCVWAFMNLFRGEVLDRSLHYYFLTPVRRGELAAGKYLAAWLATTILFVSSTWLSLGIIFSYLGPAGAADYLLSGPGLRQALSYAGITALACLGYGAVFLLVGLFFRNPIIPAVLFFMWEAINPVLPALLKKASVIFYLKSLLPIVPAEGEGPFALLSDPAPVWLAIPGLLLFTAATLALATLRVRHMEIAYGAD